MIPAEDFLMPRDLRATPSGIKKCLVVGSCMAVPYLTHFRKLEPDVVFDYLAYNNIAELPKKPPSDPAEYDFQIVQLPLRIVVTDRLVEFAQFTSEAGNESIVAGAYERLDMMLKAAMKYNVQHGIPSFVSNFIVPQMPAVASLQNQGTERDFRHLVQLLNHRLAELVRDYKNAYIIDVENIAASIGKRYFLDDIIGFFSHGVFWYPNWSERNRLDPVPPLTELSPSHIEPFISTVWRQIDYNFRVVRQIDMVKLVIFDLDDTLWRGQIAEHYNDDGQHPIYNGWPLGLSEAVHHLRARGILVAICSKNNLDIVQARWKRAAPLGWLKFEDFVVAEIGWAPKAESVGKIMAKLSLTPKSVVFVDDNPVEREAVKSAYPAIRVLGSNPFMTRRILLAAPETQLAALTAETLNRAEMLKKQQLREQERVTMSREEFLARLECKLHFTSLASADEPAFARCFELLNKTNQFNTTGKRWSPSEINAFFAGGGRIVAFTVEDKHTEYGLTGVILVANSRSFPQFVMSCRVLGLEIETSALKIVCAALLAEPGPAVFTATMLETDLNAVCRDVYERAGFTDAGGGAWELPAENTDWLVPAPHLAITQMEGFLAPAVLLPA